MWLENRWVLDAKPTLSPTRKMYCCNFKFREKDKMLDCWETSYIASGILTVNPKRWTNSDPSSDAKIPVEVARKKSAVGAKDPQNP